jgi:hypothetical protein
MSKAVGEIYKGKKKRKGIEEYRGRETLIIILVVETWVSSVYAYKSIQNVV